MYKVRNKKLALLITIVFALTIMLPLAGPASAATGYTALNKPAVSDDDTGVILGTVFAEIPAGAINSGDVLIIKTSSGVKFPTTIQENLKIGNDPAELSNFVYIPNTVGQDDNALRNASLNFEKLGSREVKATVTGTVYPNDKAFFYLYLRNMTMDKASSGDVTVSFSAPGSSGFPTGDVVVGKVVKDSEVTVIVDSDDTFTETGTITLRVKEEVLGSLKGNSPLKLRLPSGFEWGDVTELSTIWGDEGLVNQNSIASSGRDLKITAEKSSDAATLVKFDVDVTVTDETRAKFGDVEVTVSGHSGYEPSTIIIGKYVDFDATVSAEDATEIIAGQLEQEIGKIVIKEDGPGSLVEKRSITLELPANAKWTKLPEIDTDEDADIKFQRFLGTDGRTLRYQVEGASTDPDTITFKEAEVATAVDFSGELKVKVGGTAGVEGEVVVAEVLPAVTVTAEKPHVKIGVQAQPAGDIVITEAKGETLADGEDLTLEAPEGVKFAYTPTVTVTEGDLEIIAEDVRRDCGDRCLVIPIDVESTKASTITVSGIKYTVDRTYPEGEIEVKVKGNAVNAVNDTSSGGAVHDYFGDKDTAKYGNVYYATDSAVDLYLRAGNESEEGDSFAYEIPVDGMFKVAKNAATVVNATCVTPAPGDAKQAATFVIGSTTYTVNGVEQTMDVAPYVKNDRTYLPVRYVGYALGVAAENIFWDGKTATLMKGDKVVQVTMGSKAMVVNGATINMDVAPELTNDRTMLPFRWIAMAFGANVDWDQDTQTVTMEL